MTDPVAMERALAPVRSALRERARAAAAQLVDQAESAAAADLAAVRGDAQRLLAQARAEGEADAAAYVAGARARSRRTARTVVLTAQSTVYDELRRRSRAAAKDLRGQDDYAELLERLTAMARTELGDSAVVVESDDGGVTASAGPRRVDYTLTTLADRALASLGAEVERLWQP